MLKQQLSQQMVRQHVQHSTTPPTLIGVCGSDLRLLLPAARERWSAWLPAKRFRRLRTSWSSMIRNSTSGCPIRCPAATRVSTFTDSRCAQSTTTSSIQAATSPAAMILCGRDAFDMRSSDSCKAVVGTPSWFAILAVADGIYGSTIAAASATTPSKPVMYAPHSGVGRLTGFPVSLCSSPVSSVKVHSSFSCHIRDKECLSRRPSQHT